MPGLGLTCSVFLAGSTESCGETPSEWRNPWLGPALDQTKRCVNLLSFSPSPSRVVGQQKQLVCSVNISRLEEASYAFLNTEFGRNEPVAPASDNLIITATVAPAWMYPQEIEQMVRTKWEQKTEDLVEEIDGCVRAGASIVHVHGNRPWTTEKWKDVISRVRDKCDALIQVGLSGRPMTERKELLQPFRNQDGQVVNLPMD